MTKLTLVKPESGKENKTEDPKITTAFSSIETVVNGELESTNNFKKEGIKEESLAKVIQEKLGGSFAGLAVKEETANFEAESGKFYLCTKELTCTLPLSVAGRTIAIANKVSGKVVKVSTQGAQKLFVGSSEGETANLAFGTAVLLEGDGAGWFKIGGEVKNENSYTSKFYSVAEAEAGVEPSATRMAYVAIMMGGTGGENVTVGGVEVGAKGTLYVLVPPGQKWVAKPGVGINVRTLLL